MSRCAELIALTIAYFHFVSYSHEAQTRYRRAQLDAAHILSRVSFLRHYAQVRLVHIQLRLDCCRARTPVISCLNLHKPAIRRQYCRCRFEGCKSSHISYPLELRLICLLLQPAEESGLLSTRV